MKKWISRILLGLFGLLCFGMASFAQSDKSAKSTLGINVKSGVKIDYEIELSSSMKEALNKKRHSDFRMWKQVNFAPEVISEYKYTTYQSPSAVFGDFNSDNITDVALMGYDKIYTHIIVIISNNPKSNLRNSTNIIVIDPYKMASFPRKKKLVVGEYKVVEIWGNGLDKRPESTRNIKLALTLHPKGKIIKGNTTKYSDACNKVLTNDSFGVKDFGVNGVEQLFNYESMFAACIIRE